MAPAPANRPIGKKVVLNDRIAQFGQLPSDDERDLHARAAEKDWTHGSVNTFDFDGLVAKVEERLAAEHSAVYQRTTFDPTARAAYEQAVEIVLRTMDPPLAQVQQAEIRQFLLAKNTGVGVLQPLMAEPGITEIMVNGEGAVWVERQGRMENAGIRISAEQALDIAKRVTNRTGRLLNEENPVQKARLEDGSRVTVVIKPAAVYGPYINIRRFLTETRDIAQLVAMGSISEEWAAFLGDAIRVGFNIFVAGGTGTGKSTMMDALLKAYLPRGERVLVIEDMHELHVQEYLENVVVLQATKIAGEEDSKGVTMRDLLRAAFIMRPDRVIVSEVKGAETVEMIQAMLSGHRGSMSTGHTKDGKWAAINRLAEMLRQGQGDMPWQVLVDQIRSALDLIVYLERLPNGRRVVSSITEIFPPWEREDPFADLGVFNKETGTHEPLRPLSARRQAEIDQYRRWTEGRDPA